MTRFPVYTNTITFKPLANVSRISCMMELRTILGLELREAAKVVTSGTLECPEEDLVDKVMNALRRHTTDVEREKSPMTRDEHGFMYCKRSDWHNEAIPTCVILED